MEVFMKNTLKVLALMLVLCLMFTACAAPAADATTVAPAATTAAPKKGCGGTIALTALALVPMLGAAVVFGKKKED